MCDIKTLLIAAAAAALLPAAAALADDDCEGPAGFALGVEVDDDCRQIMGHGPAGGRTQGRLDPASLRPAAKDDDDDDGDDDDEGDDDDDDGAGGGRPARGTAPVTPVAPPNNPLFGTGTAPVVRVK